MGRTYFAVATFTPVETNVKRRSQKKQTKVNRSYCEQGESETGLEVVRNLGGTTNSPPIQLACSGENQESKVLKTMLR
jgi:hypothetical protein